MRDYVPRIHGAGAELVIVGNGTPEQARWFIEDFHIDTPVFTDPTLGIHRALGARRGVRLSKLPRLLGNAVRAMGRGHFQTRVLGDGKQLGGVFVIMAGGTLTYRYLSEVAGDHPDPNEVAPALEGAVRQRSPS
ncbi:MAG: AhpC/TSA family protein [Dehalococcoidia bacterium]|nr:AhpC/TSA family protein [Dehalococcoidia bacterium]